MQKPHKSLDCWQRAVGFVTELYQITAHFPAEEKFGITSQLRRAAVSIPANIAEGAGRNTAKEFLQFLFIARGSLAEVDTLLTVSINLKFLNDSDYQTLLQSLENTSRPLHGLIQKLKAQTPNIP